MDIGYLKCFIAVAEELHFGRAAHRLHLTPSPVSRHIRALERELNADLFVRAYHDVQLTPAGETLYPRALEVVRAFDEMIRMPLPRASGLSVLRLGASPIAPARLMQSFRALIEEQYPSVQLGVEIDWSANLVEMLGPRLDGAIVNLPIDVPGVESVTLLDQQYHVVLLPSDPLADAESVTIEDLRGHEFVMTSSRHHPQLMNRMRELMLEGGVGPVIELDSTDPAVVAAHLRQGVRCALALRGTPQAAIFDEFALVPLDSHELRSRYGIAWNSAARRHDPKLDEILGALTAHSDTTSLEGVRAVAGASS